MIIDRAVLQMFVLYGSLLISLSLRNNPFISLQHVVKEDDPRNAFASWLKERKPLTDDDSFANSWPIIHVQILSRYKEN